jgi:hypothetical protein
MARKSFGTRSIAVSSIIVWLVGAGILFLEGSHGDVPRPSSPSLSPQAPKAAAAANRFLGRNPKRGSNIIPPKNPGPDPPAGSKKATRRGDRGVNDDVATLLEEELEMSSSRLSGKGGRGGLPEIRAGAGDYDDEDFEFDGHIHGLNLMGGFLSDDEKGGDVGDYEFETDDHRSSSGGGSQNRRFGSGEGSGLAPEDVGTMPRMRGWGTTSSSDGLRHDDHLHRQQNGQLRDDVGLDHDQNEGIDLLGSHISSNTKEAMYEAYNQLHVLAQVRDITHAHSEQL